VRYHIVRKRTRAYLRNAELGFLGVIVPTRVHTPRFCGEFKSVNLRGGHITCQLLTN
jgi:hypothetical protein